MLYPVAGCRFFIAAAPASPWVEIDGVEAFGLLGSEWSVETADILGNCDADENPVEWAMKGVLRRPEIPLILGNDPTDPGQALIWAASRSRDAFPFRILFPDGTTERSWQALVIRIGEVFDTANSVIRLQADLKPVSEITRSEAP